MGRTNNVKENSERVYNNVKVGNIPIFNYTKHGTKSVANTSGKSQEKIRRAQRIADSLVRKFGPRSNKCYKYFCKCAYRLPEYQIWNYVEDSHKPRIKNSLAYFLSVTKAQPEMS